MSTGLEKLVKERPDKREEVKSWELKEMMLQQELEETKMQPQMPKQDLLKSNRMQQELEYGL